MKKISCVIIIFFTFCSTFAQTEPSKSKMAFRGYSGGMFFHMGYVKGGNFNLYDKDDRHLKTLSVEGMPKGLGGALRFQFGKHLRIGGEGYTSTTRYNGNESYLRVGWGGLLADCVWKHGRWMPYIGAAVGGGGVKNFTVLQDTPEDFITEQDVSYRKFSIFTITPFTGVEFLLTPKISVVFMADYQFELTKNNPDYAPGVRFYIGIMFNRTTH